MRAQERYTDFGRIECPEICIVNGVLDDISINGCKVHFAAPITINLENDYEVRVRLSRSSQEPLVLMCHPQWVKDQGNAADIIKMAMVSIHRRLKEEGLQAQMIMQVHDELNFNVPEQEVDRVREIVVSEMQNAVHLSIPLIAECGVGKNWLEAH